MSTARKLISPGKIKALHTVFPKAGLSREDYDACLAAYGVEHTNELYDYQAAELLMDLSKRLPQEQKYTRTPHKTHKSPALPPAGHPSGHGKKGWQLHLTQPQAERIAILGELLGWNSVSLHKFINRQLKKNAGVEMLMNYEARKIIIGMQRILAGNNKAIYKKLNSMNNEKLREWNE